MDNAAAVSQQKKAGSPKGKKEKQAIQKERKNQIQKERKQKRAQSEMSIVLCLWLVALDGEAGHIAMFGIDLIPKVAVVVRPIARGDVRANVLSREGGVVR